MTGAMTLTLRVSVLLAPSGDVRSAAQPGGDAGPRGRRRRLSTSLKVDLTVAASKAGCAWSSNGIVSASMVWRPPPE